MIVFNKTKTPDVVDEYILTIVSDKKPSMWSGDGNIFAKKKLLNSTIHNAYVVTLGFISFSFYCTYCPVFSFHILSMFYYEQVKEISLLCFYFIITFIGNFNVFFLQTTTESSKWTKNTFPEALNLVVEQ